MSNQARWALITNNRAGWGTMRRRWEKDLQEPEGPTMVLHLEEEARAWGRLTDRWGFRSSWHLLAGRAAAEKAVRAGCRVILFSTLHYAAWVPRHRDVRYLIYGDSTPDQLCRLYDGRPLAGMFRLMHQRLKRLAEDGHQFLCMSRWYAEGLRTEYGVPESQLTFLPPYVDTELWKPSAVRENAGTFRVVFLGADWRRKGGDLVVEMASRPEFRDWQWDLVSPAAPAELPSNCRAHRQLRAESVELRALVGGANLLVLPTRADCSSLATLEAASCGVPAVITNTGGVGDLVETGVTGTLLSRADSAELRAGLEPYRKDPGLAVQQGQAARQRVEQLFSRSVHLQTIYLALSRAGVS